LGSRAYPPRKQRRGRGVARRKSRKLPEIPPWAEIVQLLEATGRQRDRLMLMLGAFMGLRVSEIVKLQVPHLDFGRAMLYVRGGKGDADRAVPIPDFLHGPLRGWIGARRTGPVFTSRKGGGPLTTRGVQHLLKRVAQKAGLPDALKARKYHPHVLRHAAACRWLETDGTTIYDVKELLGHSNVAVTERYLHTTPQRLANVVNGGPR